MSWHRTALALSGLLWAGACGPGPSGQTDSDASSTTSTDSETTGSSTTGPKGHWALGVWFTPTITGCAFELMELEIVDGGAVHGWHHLHNTEEIEQYAFTWVELDDATIQLLPDDGAGDEWFFGSLRDGEITVARQPDNPDRVLVQISSAPTVKAPPYGTYRTGHGCLQESPPELPCDSGKIAGPCFPDG